LASDVERATKAGFDQHVAKPAGPELLEKVIAQAQDLTAYRTSRASGKASGPHAQ
jgi:hypothetical protein